MAFHGYSARDIQYGRNMADKDLHDINDDATAAELARIAERSKRGSHVGVSVEENLDTLHRVTVQAMAQLAVARELGVATDEHDYGLVVARSQEFLDLWAHEDTIRYTSEEQRDAYRKLLEQS